MNLQERIDFILNKHFPASVKRKHLSRLMLHLGDYSEDADELGQAYDRICEALEELDNESVENNMINFRMIPRGSGKIAYTEELIKQQMEEDNMKKEELKDYADWLKGKKEQNEKEKSTHYLGTGQSSF